MNLLVLQLLLHPVSLGNLTCKHKFIYHLSNDDSQNISNPQQSPSVFPETSACPSHNAWFMPSCQAQERVFTAHFSLPPVFSASFSNAASCEENPVVFSNHINLSLSVCTHTVWLQSFFIALLLFCHIKVLVFISKFFRCFIFFSVEFISFLISTNIEASTSAASWLFLHTEKLPRNKK